MGTKSGKPRFNCKRALLTLATYSRRPVDGIPRTQAEWDQVLIDQVKRQIGIKNLSRSELRKVVRKSIQLIRDGDGKEEDHEASPADDTTEVKPLPVCIDWDLTQVCDWLSANEFGGFQEAFRVNGITGKRLVTINTKFLVSVGFSIFDDVRKLVKTIRKNLLNLPENPNTFDEISWEKFLWRKSEPDTSTLTYSHYTGTICTAFDPCSGDGREAGLEGARRGALERAP